ncbi:MAG: hypothetical protein WC641_07580 [Patescibacteria group bacterium]
MFKEPRPETHPSALVLELKREVSLIEKLHGRTAKWLGMAILALSTEGCYGLLPKDVNLAWSRSLENTCKSLESSKNEDMCNQAEKLEKRYADDEAWDKRDLELVKNWNRLPIKEKDRLVRTYGPKRIEKTRWAYSRNEFRY